MSEVRINLNEHIRFKLTDHGKDLYYHQHDGLLALNPKYPIKRKMPPVDDDGYTTMQLWCFMELYGPYMHIGSEPIIEHLEIIYDQDSKTNVEN